MVLENPTICCTSVACLLTSCLHCAVSLLSHTPMLEQHDMLLPRQASRSPLTLCVQMANSHANFSKLSHQLQTFTLCAHRLMPSSHAKVKLSNQHQTLTPAPNSHAVCAQADAKPTLLSLKLTLLRMPNSLSCACQTHSHTNAKP